MANFLNPLTVAPNDVTADTYFDAITKQNISSIWLAAQLGLISFDISVVSGNIRISLKDIEGNSPSVSNPVYSFARKNGSASVFEYTSFISDRSIDIPSTNRLGYRTTTTTETHVGYIYLFRQDGGASWNIGVSGMGLGVCASKTSYTSSSIITGLESINSLYTNLSGTVTGTIIPIQAFSATHNGVVWLTATPGTRLKSNFTLPYIAYNYGQGINPTSYATGQDIDITHNLNDRFARAELYIQKEGTVINAPVEVKIKQNTGLVGVYISNLVQIFPTSANVMRYRQHTSADTYYVDSITDGPSFAGGGVGQLIIDGRYNVVIWPSVKGF